MVAHELPVGASRGVRLARVGVVLTALALLLGYYAWTATSSGNSFTKATPWTSFHYGDRDFYNLQADAFLHGRLSLDIDMSPSAPLVRDVSFYNGQYYLSWGPAPALTTFLPPRLVGLRVQENLVVTLYAFFGVLFGIAALTLLIRHLIPGVPRSVVWVGNATLALATALPWILRRPTVYEVAITAAFCFAMGGFLLLVRESLRPRPPRVGRLALAGVLYGLAILSRPTVVVVAVAALGLTWALRCEGSYPPRLTRTRAQAIGALLGPAVVAGVLFLIYNAIRFSGALDFGNRWQLTSRDVRNLPYNELSNLMPSLYGYVLAPLRVGLEFPYIQLPPPPKAPLTFKEGFVVEPTASLLWAVPFALLAAALLVRALRRRRGDIATRVPKRVTCVVVALLAMAALPLLIGAYGVPGYTERYELDFLPYMIMAATIAWAELIRGASSRRRAAGWRRGGMALAAYSSLIGVAIGFTGYDDTFKANNQGAFRTLQRLTSPLPTLVTALAGRPMIAGVFAPAGMTVAQVSYTTFGPEGASVMLQKGRDTVVTVISPDGRGARLLFNLSYEAPDAAQVVASSIGQSTAADVRTGAAVALPVHLRRGANFIKLAIEPKPGVPPPDSSLAVKLTDIRLH